MWGRKNVNLQLIAKAVVILWLVRNFVVFFLPIESGGGLSCSTECWVFKCMMRGWLLLCTCTA